MLLLCFLIHHTIMLVIDSNSVLNFEYLSNFLHHEVLIWAAGEAHDDIALIMKGLDPQNIVSRVVQTHPLSHCSMLPRRLICP
jgi:hypothetical protein